MHFRFHLKNGGTRIKSLSEGGGGVVGDSVGLFWRGHVARINNFDVSYSI